VRQGARRLARFTAKERGTTLLIVLAAISTGNAIRREVNRRNGDSALEPLTTDQVCIALPDGASDEGPLVVLADKKGFVALSLSTETETSHYHFLERCSFEQSSVNRSKPIDAKVKIGWVCPALAHRAAREARGAQP